MTAAADHEPIAEVPLGEVSPGDLIFTTRPGAFQLLCEVAGDRWRHVGLAIELDGVMSIIEVFGDRFAARDLAEVVPQQEAVGIVRLPSSLTACVDRALDWSRSLLGHQQLYAWDDVILAGIILTTRRRLRFLDLERIAAAVAQADRAARATPGRSLTCSGFVYEAFRAAGPSCRLPVDFEAPRIGAHREGESTASSSPSISQLMVAPPAVAAAMLAEHSLYELSVGEDEAGDDEAGPGEDGPGERSNHGTRISGPQLASLVRGFVRFVAGLTFPQPAAGPGTLDGRWVTPGDLWRLDDVALRGYLKRPADELLGTRSAAGAELPVVIRAGQEIILGRPGRVIALAVDEPPDDAVLDELRAWAESASGQEVRPRSPDLVEAVTMTALATAAIHGTVGNLAYSAFPRAASYLRRRSQRPGGGLGSHDAADLAKRHTLRHHGFPGDRCRITSLERLASGAWEIDVRVDSGSEVAVSIAADGAVVASHERAR